jgi:hypothetical protein
VRTLLIIVVLNVAYVVIEVSRLTRRRVKGQNFKTIQAATSKLQADGWIPLRVTWHGLWRTQPHMVISHPDHPGEHTLRLSAPLLTLAAATTTILEGDQ